MKKNIVLQNSKARFAFQPVDNTTPLDYPALLEREQFDPALVVNADEGRLMQFSDFPSDIFSNRR